MESVFTAVVPLIQSHVDRLPQGESPEAGMTEGPCCDHQKEEKFPSVEEESDPAPSILHAPRRKGLEIPSLSLNEVIVQEMIDIEQDSGDHKTKGQTPGTEHEEEQDCPRDTDPCMNFTFHSCIPFQSPSLIP